MNNWRKRIITEITCPSGNVVTVRRPGASMALKAGKISRLLDGQPKDAKNLEAQITWMESLSDDELDLLTDYAERIMPDIVVKPVVSLNPKDGEYHPHDIPVADFWNIFLRVMTGLNEAPVKLKDGETTVEAVETFSSEQAGSLESGDNSEVIQ